MRKGSDTSFFNLVLSSPFYVWSFCVLEIVLHILLLPLHTFADCKISTMGRYLNYDWYSTRGGGILVVIIWVSGCS